MSDHYQALRELAMALAEKGANGIADLARMLRPHSPNPEVSAKLEALAAAEPKRMVPRGDAA